MADRRRMVERTDHPDVLRSASARRRTSRAIRGSRNAGVVRAKTLRDFGGRNTASRLSLYSAFRTPHSALYVYRAPLPLRLLVPRRCLAPRAARAHRVAAGLPRARAHRPQRPVRLDGVRTGSETARAPGDHRSGADATRRLSWDDSRGDARRVREPLPVDYGGASRPC